MKEVRIKMKEEDHKKLLMIAQESFRSLTQQAVMYILQGIKEERREQEESRG